MKNKQHEYKTTLTTSIIQATGSVLVLITLIVEICLWGIHYIYSKLISAHNRTSTF